MSKIIKCILEVVVVVFLAFYYNFITLKGIIKHNKNMKATTEINEIIYQKNYFSKNKYYVIYKANDGSYYGRATKQSLESLKEAGAIIDYDVEEANLVIGFIGVMVMIIIPLLKMPSKK